jgi:type II secretory pathway pseudopilin PulG
MKMVMKIRKAIALIELIFAIVVIAITLLSVPNLISQTTQASNKAITQEAISNAASYASLIMSSFWDESDTDPKVGNPILVVDKNTTGLAEKEINTTINAGGIPDGNGGIIPDGNGVGENFEQPTSIIGVGSRIGSALTSPRRFAIDNIGNRLTATQPDNLGQEPTDSEPDDVDDFNNKDTYLVLESITNAKTGDYKDTKIKISTKVVYIDDMPNPSFNNKVIRFDNPFNNELNISTNIKKITLTLTSDNDKNKKIKLNSFSCNIGSGKLKERIF